MDNKGLWGDETAEWIRALTTAPKPEYGKKWKRTDDTRQGDAAYILRTKPDAEIGLLVQDSQFRKDY
jgi:hypothetical protein